MLVFVERPSQGLDNATITAEAKYSINYTHSGKIFMLSSVHIDGRNKNISVLGEGPTQALDNTVIPAQGKYSTNFTESGKRFMLSLHYNGSNSFLFVNATKIYQFRGKDSEVKRHHYV